MMSKQESIGLRLKKTFLGEEIIEDFSALNYLIDFYFPKYKLAVEIDELGHAEEFSAYDGLREIYKFFDKFKKREIKTLEKEKISLKEKISKWLLELKFEKKHLIKSKCLKWIVKKILPTL